MGENVHDWARALSAAPDWLRIEDPAAHTEVEDVQPEDIAALGARSSLPVWDLGHNTNLLLHVERHIAWLEWPLMLMAGGREVEPAGSAYAVGGSGPETVVVAVES